MAENTSIVYPEDFTTADDNGHEETTYNQTILTTGNETGWPDNKDHGLNYVGYVIVPTLCIAGLLGNVCNIVIMRTKYFRSSSFSIFLTALAISDSIYLLTAPFTWTFMKDVFNRDVRAISVAGCKAFFCIFRSAKICSSWIVVVICMERFIAVWFPLKAKLISNKKTAAVTACTIFINVYAIDGAWTITTDIINGVCHPNVVTEGTKDLATGFVIFGTAIFNIIPTILLLTFTPLIILKLFQQRKIRKQMSSNTGADETYRVTFMLLWVTVAYIVLVTPISVAHSVAFFQGDSIFESTDPGFVVFRDVAHVFEQMNYSVNFFLYVGTNRTFRQRICYCFGLRQRPGQPNNHRVPDPAARLQNVALSSSTGTVSSSVSASIQSSPSLELYKIYSP